MSCPRNNMQRPLTYFRASERWFNALFRRALHWEREIRCLWSLMCYLLIQLQSADVSRHFFILFFLLFFVYRLRLSTCTTTFCRPAIKTSSSVSACQCGHCGHSIRRSRKAGHSRKALKSTKWLAIKGVADTHTASAEPGTFPFQPINWQLALKS